MGGPVAVQCGTEGKSKKIAEDGWLMLYIGPRLHAKSTEFGAFSPLERDREECGGKAC